MYASASETNGITAGEKGAEEEFSDFFSTCAELFKVNQKIKRVAGSSDFLSCFHIFNDF